MVANILRENTNQSPAAFIVNVSISYTKIVIHKHRLVGSNMRLIEILRLMYKEMKANEYDFEAIKEWIDVGKYCALNYSKLPQICLCCRKKSFLNSFV